MRKVLLLFLSFSCFSSFSQILTSELVTRIYTRAPDIKYVNQSFDNFKYNPVIDSLEKVTEQKFTNVAGCLGILEADSVGNFLTLVEKNMILERLRELSKKLFQQATPIVILDTGMKSTETAKKLNANKKEKFLYISLGNTCLSTGGLTQGIAVINHTTHTLVKK